MLPIVLPDDTLGLHAGRRLPRCITVQGHDDDVVRVVPGCDDRDERAVGRRPPLVKRCRIGPWKRSRQVGAVDRRDHDLGGVRELLLPQDVAAIVGQRGIEGHPVAFVEWCRGARAPLGHVQGAALDGEDLAVPGGTEERREPLTGLGADGHGREDECQDAEGDEDDRGPGDRPEPRAGLHGEPPFEEGPAGTPTGALDPPRHGLKEPVGLAHRRQLVQPGGDESVEAVGGGHACPPSASGRRASASRAARSCWVVRKSRDFTVPIGSPRISAVSCIDSPRW